MKSRDSVRYLLRRRNAPPNVVRGGLQSLLKRWEKTVAAVTAGYTLGSDDYLNDMDGRQLIHEALQVATDAQKSRISATLARIDADFLAASEPAAHCIWGPKAAAENRWTKDQNWWYFRLPRLATPDFRTLAKSARSKP